CGGSPVDTGVALGAVPTVTALMASFAAGESANGSLSVAVNVDGVPVLTAPAAEYAMEAVGAVLSTEKVAPLVGVAVTTLPARSVPTLVVTAAVPFPACTV